MSKQREEQLPELRPVYLRMTPELVAWLDAEAKRQRRSRAFIMSQAVRLMRAMFAELEEHPSAGAVHVADPAQIELELVRWNGTQVAFADFLQQRDPRAGQLPLKNEGKRLSRVRLAIDPQHAHPGDGLEAAVSGSRSDAALSVANASLNKLRLRDLAPAARMGIPAQPQHFVGSPSMLGPVAPRTGAVPPIP